MSNQGQPLDIDGIIRELTPRVGDLTERARAMTAPVQTVLQDAIEQLRSTVEELEVAREELLAQNTLLAHDSVSRSRDLEWHRNLFDRAPQPLLVTNTSGKIVAANRAAGELMGVRADGLAGKPVGVYVHESDRPAFRRWLNHLPVDDGLAVLEVRVHPRGRLPLLARLEVAAGGQGEGGESMLHWTLRDVTEERRAEAARDEVTEMLLATLRSAGAPLAALDVDGTVLFWNPAAERLLGWDEEEAVGRPFPGAGEATHTRLRTARDDAGMSFDAEVRTADGTLARIAFTTSPLVDPSGRVRGVAAVLAPAVAEAASEAPRRSWSREEALEALLAGGDLARDPLGRIRAWLAAGLHLGYLRAGDRLPSIRQISAAASVDHRAVSLAYRTLSAEGTVEVRDRYGVHLCAPPVPQAEELCESAEWLAGSLASASALRIRAELIPDMVRRWTASVAVRCACVESCEDELAALTGELRQQWGLDTFAVAVPEDGSAPRHRDAPGLVESLRGAGLVVTTPFHERAVRAAAAPSGVPVVVVAMSPEVVDAAEARLAEGPLTVVAADEGYGRRLRALRGAGGDRLRLVVAGDRVAVAGLDPAEPVLLTRAAQARLSGFRPRLLVPVAPMLSPDSARQIAQVLIQRNMEAGRGS